MIEEQFNISHFKQLKIICIYIGLIQLIQNIFPSAISSTRIHSS